jgi:hypothetical protein
MMEAVMQVAELILRVVLVGALALTPGMAVWLAVAGIIIAGRRVRSVIQERTKPMDEEPAFCYPS